MTKFESQDVVFLKEDYPTKGEIDKDFQFYEMEDLDYGASSHSVKGLEETLNPFKNSRNDYVPNPTPIEQDHKKSQPRLSTCERITRRRFEIKGETFMITPHDDKETKTVNKALFGPQAKEWIKAMKEKMESMNAN